MLANSIKKIFILGLCLFNFSSAIKLNRNGGYELSVALSERNTFRGEAYISSIQGILTSFSNHLFLATNGTFFLKSVNIIVPSTWTSGPDNPIVPDAPATSESFETSDIQVGDYISVPFVENPNVCGRPGEFIELPTSFFANKNDGVYGIASKALLNQWARYRWGVWEEHGMPGDARFPYFHKLRPDDQQWKTTGCANEEIHGQYVDQFDETSPDCDPNDPDKEMAIDCRFKPNPSGQNATTSLMHFHFLESVTEFCDGSNHNRDAPNKQNEFCGYKSVLEVMRETPDYKSVTPITSPSLPAIQFKTIGISRRPIMYILLDKGEPGLSRVLEKFSTKFAPLFDSAVVEPILASVGTYPSMATTGSSYVQEQIPWTPISDMKEAFKKIVLDPPAENAPANRDFGLAIFEAIENIKLKHPAGQAILLIVKTGAGNGNFGNIAYEGEVRAALLNQKIKLVSVEIQVGGETPYVNLKSLTNSTSGDHTVITGSNVEGPVVADLIKRIEQLLGAPVPNVPHTILIHKGPVPHNEPMSVFLRPSLSRMDFALTYPANAELLLSIPPGTNTEDPISEWDENVDAQRRSVIRGSALLTGDVVTNGRLWTLKYECISNCVGISAQLVVYGTFRFIVSENPDIFVYTTAVDNVVNLNDTKDSDSPFSIFARVSLSGGVPVANLEVEAAVQTVGGQALPAVPMADDGLGSPDLTKNDGIYSGTFIPPADGNYRITVRVVNSQLRPRPPPDTPSARLLPQDQNLLGCTTPNCQPLNLTKLFEATADLASPVTIRNRASFQAGKPVKIRDLTVSFQEGVGVRLEFVSPQLVGAPTATGVQYWIYLSKTKEALLGDLSNPGEDVELRFKSAEAPGKIEDFAISTGLNVDFVHVAIMTYNGNQKSELSVIKSTRVDQSGITQSPSTVNTETPDPTEPSIPPVTGVPSVPPVTDPTESTGSTTTSPSTTTTTPPPPEEDEPFFETTWGIVVIVAIVLVVLMAGGGIFYYCYSVRGCYNARKEHERSSRPTSPRPDSYVTDRERP